MSQSLLAFISCSTETASELLCIAQLVILASNPRAINLAPNSRVSHCIVTIFIMSNVTIVARVRPRTDASTNFWRCCSLSSHHPERRKVASLMTFIKMLKMKTYSCSTKSGNPAFPHFVHDFYPLNHFPNHVVARRSTNSTSFLLVESKCRSVRRMHYLHPRANFPHQQQLHQSEPRLLCLFVVNELSHSAALTTISTLYIVLNMQLSLSMLKTVAFERYLVLE